MKNLKEQFTIQGFSVEEIIQTKMETVIIKASSICTQAICPKCHQLSTKQHSTYIRHPQDLPWRGNTLLLHLKVKRFRCHNPKCSQITFAEPTPALVTAYAQRTTQLDQVLHAISFETSAEATARISRQLKIQISPDTILRILRKTIFHNFACPRVLGVDDWALKRGQNYGTLLVDLETRKPVDLLTGRNSTVLESWLKEHPKIAIVSRDRSKEYKAGIDAALPKAIQIADRWHLYLNLRQRLEKIIAKERRKPKTEKKTVVSPRQKNFENVRYLHARGYSSRAIARALDINRGTVMKYIHADHLPDWQKTVPPRSNLDPYDAYIRKRWREGCHQARTIWQELCELGYQGKYKSVNEYLNRYRINSGYTPIQAVWLFLKAPEKLAQEDEEYLHLFLGESPNLEIVYQLTQQLLSMLSQHTPEGFDQWLSNAEQCGVLLFENFAKGIRQDYEAVLASLSSPWSNGQTEGQVNRLKLIKRQMYGRANFDLLRIKVLGPP